MRARIAETVTVSRQTIPAFTLDRFVSTEALGEGARAAARRATSSATPGSS